MTKFFPFSKWIATKQILLWLVLIGGVYFQPALAADEEQARKMATRSADFLKSGNLDSAQWYMDSALVLWDKPAWPKWLVQPYYKLTQSYFNKSFYEKSYEQAMELLENHFDKFSIQERVGLYEIQASSGTFTGKIEAAQATYKRMFDYIKSIDENDVSADDMIDFRVMYLFGNGILMAMQGDFNKGLDYFMKADTLLQNGGNDINKVEALTYMGNIYGELMQFEKAIFMFEKVEKLHQTGIEVDMQQVYDNIVICHTMLEQFDQSEKYLEKGLALARKRGDSLAVGYNYLNQGHLYEAKKDFKLAIQKFTKATELFIAADNEPLTVEAQSVLVGLANRTGLTTPAHLDIIDEVIAYNQSIKAHDRYTRAIRYKSHALLNLGYFEAAARLYKELDSVNNYWHITNFQETTAELETQFRTNLYKEEAETQAQIATILTLQNKRKTQFIVFFIILLIVLMIAGFSGYKLLTKLRASKEEIAAQNVILSKREDEKSLLLKELHHRVKNNLQIVSSLLYLQSISAKDQSAQNAFKDGQHRVDAMAMIHKYLYTSDELTQVDITNYLSRLVESIAYSYNYSRENLKLDFDSSSAAIDVDIAIPLGLIANELVSNAFKHAFEGVVHPQLKISLKRDNGIVFQVADNGKGMPESFVKENSFGMELIQSLETQLNGKLEYSYSNGACFTLFVPEKTLQNIESQNIKE
ncbi:MAG: sensor histidine kinase [Schleiferiaceae bacterium]|nr:sensor histidine kinase [Schleiferiaceae bacterium]